MKLALLAPSVSILVLLASVSGCATSPAPAMPEAPLEQPPALEPAYVVPRTTGWPPSQSVVRTSTPPVGAHIRPAALPGAAPTRSLGTGRLSGLNLEDEPSLREAMQFIEAATGIDVHVENVAEEAMRDAGILLNIQIDRPISVRSALDLICEFAGDDVAWTRRHGIVLVTTPEKARGEPVSMVFDISDLTRGIPSYAAREMDIQPSGGIARDVEPAELDSVPIMQEQMILDLIRATIAAGTWDEPGNSISIRNGRLFVRHD